MANDTAIVESIGTITETQLADLGWELKSEGLCQGETCVVVSDRSALVGNAGIDLAVLADLLDRPVIIDTESGLAALGADRGRRRSALVDLVAPDFVLPDLDGGLTALSDHRSKKRLLVAFSSW
jgi:hypothetical protein